MQACNSLQTDNNASTPPLFLQAGCPSCRPTNSVKALKALKVIVNNQINKGLLLNLRVKMFFKSVNIWQSYKQERDCFVHFLSLLAVCWPSAQSARDNHILACNFAKYSPILIFYSQFLNLVINKLTTHM